MSRFASLSSPSSRVRGLLQARLYYAREKNREVRKSKFPSAVPISVEEVSGSMTDNGDGTYTMTGAGHIRFRFDHTQLVDAATYRIAFAFLAKDGTQISSDFVDTTNILFQNLGNVSYERSRATYSETFNYVDVNALDGFTIGTPSLTRVGG